MRACLLQGGRLIAAEGPAWAEVVAATFGPTDDVQWREAVVHAVGLGEMERDEVGRVLRRREDFQASGIHGYGIVSMRSVGLQ